MSDPISTDLAIVGRVSRARPIALESTLRAVGALPSPPVASRAADVSLVVMSRIYAQRVARIAGGVAVIAYLLTRVVVALVPTTEEALRNWTALDTFLWEPSWVQTLGGLSLVYLLALHAGARAFRHAIAGAADMHTRAKELVGHIDGWSIAIAIGATTTFVIVALAAHFLYFGDLLWLRAVGTSDWSELDALTYAIPLVVPLVVGLVAAFVVARRYRASAAPPWVIPFAVPALAVALSFVSSGREQMRLAHYIAFVAGMGVVVLVVAGWALSRRRREVAAMKETP